MSKKKVLFSLILFSFILISSCAQLNNSEVKKEKEIIADKKGQQMPDKQKSELPELGLGNLCRGESGCISFCNNNRGQCEAYCRGKGIELCKIIFPPDAQDQGPQKNNGCAGKGAVTFKSPPMPIEKIGIIEPIGLMIGGHVTPI
ncbi:MAG: hypothetical protein AABX34_00690, partial [Nanoarchaeota archaeon]